MGKHGRERGDEMPSDRTGDLRYIPFDRRMTTTKSSTGEGARSHRSRHESPGEGAVASFDVAAQRVEVDLSYRRASADRD